MKQGVRKGSLKDQANQLLDAGMNPADVKRKLGLTTPYLRQILQENRAIGRATPIRVPHFDGWDFTDDNVETGRM